MMRLYLVKRKLVSLIVVITISLTGIIWIGFSLGDKADAASLNVNNHSKSDIVDHIKSNGVSTDDSLSFSVLPEKNGTLGELTDDSKQNALKMLNAIRYIAGLDPVALDSTYGRKAQSAAFVDWAIGKLTHYPGSESSKPQGMSETVWNEGVEGAANSNIAYGRDNLNDTIVNGWMGDSSSASNVENVGHRRWCLNPAMEKTGFGATTGESYTDKYYAMWSSDDNANGSQTNVAWPARIMPVEFFDSSMCWHLSTGNTSINNISNVSVKLTRRSSSPSGYKVWNFSTDNAYSPNKGTSEYFGVQINDPYQGYSGQPGPFVVFRPENTDYAIGDVFDVEINGLGEKITYTVEFISAYPVEELSFENESYYLKGSSRKILPQTTPSSAKGYEITYTSSDESVATVSNDGTVTKVASSGETTITATIAGAYTADGNPLTASYVLKIPKSITDDDISVNVSNPEYTGSVVRPEVKITDTSLNKTLVEDVDYTLSYNKDLTEPKDGQARVNIKGINGYSGSDYYYSIIYEVEKKKITESMITLSDDSFEYNGSVQKPTVTVKNNELNMTEGTDYTVSMSESKNAGSYKVSVSGNGNYGGNAEAGYQITAKSITDDSITVSVSEGSVYNGSQLKPSVTVKDGNKELVKDKDYELAYSNNINAGNGANITVTGKGNYNGERDESFSIDTADISDAAVTITDAGKKTVNGKDVFIATGDEIRPAIEVTFGANTLTEGTDYEISYDNNTAPGEAEIVLTGKGNYDNASTKTISFTIMSQEDYTAALNEEQDDPGNNDNPGGNTVSGDNNKPGSNNKPGNNENNKKQRLAQKGKDGTALGTGASAEAAEAAITSRKSDSDPAGALFGKIQLKAGKITKNLINVKWKKVSGAKTYTIYANKCGAANKMIKLATTGSCSFNITKAAGKALKKGTYYKMIVVALDAKKNVVTTSKVIHVATAGGKVGNNKSVTVKAKIGKKTKKVKAVKVKVKKKIKLKAAAVPANKKLKVKKHIAVRFESTNKNIASVNKAGLVKGLKKGKCVVYAYAQNGVFAAVKITVK